MVNVIIFRHVQFAIFYEILALTILNVLRRVLVVILLEHTRLVSQMIIIYLAKVASFSGR